MSVPTSDSGRLTGRRILVTGAAGGIGHEVARELAAFGAEIIVAARDLARARDVARELGTGATAIALDVADPVSVRTAAASLRESVDRIDVLVNNAGVLMNKRELLPSGLERTWATNVVGPFLLTNELEPLLRASAGPRVVMVGSVAQRFARRVRFDDTQFARRRFSGGAAYSHSKLALLLLTHAYADRAPWLASVCVHPGTIATGIFRRMPWPVAPVLSRFWASPSLGAKPIVRLAIDPTCASLRGAYFDKTIEENPPRGVHFDDGDVDRLWALLEAQTSAR